MNEVKVRTELIMSTYDDLGKQQAIRTDERTVSNMETEFKNRQQAL